MTAPRLRPRGAPRRCALCHGDLAARRADAAGPSPDAVACACGAVAHADCMAAHGRCPTLGCPGRGRGPSAHPGPPCPHDDRPLGPLARAALALVARLLGPEGGPAPRR